MPTADTLPAPASRRRTASPRTASPESSPSTTTATKPATCCSKSCATSRRTFGSGGRSPAAVGIGASKGCAVVPYRLPELLAEPTRPVVVVEGEKDVRQPGPHRRVGDVQRRRRGEVDGRACGVSARPACNRAARQRRSRAQPRPASRPIAPRHRRIGADRRTARPCPTKGDVSDWIAAGGTKDELRAAGRSRARLDAGRRRSRGPKSFRSTCWTCPTFRRTPCPTCCGNGWKPNRTPRKRRRTWPACLALAVCSVGIARRVVVEPRPGWREPVNLFVAVLLEPGNRKSAVFADAMQPLRELEAELIEAARPAVAREQSDRRQAEARLRKLEKMAAEKGDAEAAARSRQPGGGTGRASRAGLAPVDRR